MFLSRLRPGVTTAIIALLGLLSGQGGVGHASHGEAQEVHVCVKDSKDGATAKLKRFVDDPTDLETCKTDKGETIITWNTIGTEGADGIAGPRGRGVENLGFSRTTIGGTLNESGAFASMTIGTDGLPIISYRRASGPGDGDLYVTHCGDTACTTGNDELQLDAAGDVGYYTSIAIGSDGLPVVSYFDANSGDGNLKVAHCTSVTCGSSGIPQTVDSTGQVGAHSSIAIGADGFPVISYHRNGSNNDLKVVHCNDVACAPGGETFTLIDAASIVGTDTSIAIGSDGLPIISYRALTLADLKVVHCTIVTCGTSDPVQTVDGGNVAPTGTSLAIGADGLPLIAYRIDNDLNLLHCGDVACSSGNTTQQLDAVGDVPSYPSLAISPDGLPVVSYFEGTSSDIKMAHCGDATCSASNSQQVLDAGDVAPEKTAIANGIDGLPVIAYQLGAVNGDLRVAHCSNRLCVPFDRVG